MNADQRGRHLYVVGSTGVGKSKLLEHLVRQDIKAWPKSRCGLLLLDPHGSVYRNTIEWLAAGGRAALKRPVIPIDLTQDEWVVAYNPLRRRESARPSVVVGALVSAIVHVFGSNSTRRTPLMARWLQNTLRLLYDSQAALTELVLLLENSAFRNSLIEATSDPVARRDWQNAALFSPEKFDDQIGSTLNRLQAFIRNELFEASFGQTETSLDLRRALDEGSIILVNCSQTGGKVSEEDCQLFATLMLSDLWTAAKEREKADTPKPFYVYIDEFQNFVTETIAKNLDQARGYGLHLTLAHQYPKQLKNEGEAGVKIYDSVLANASSKIVFRMEHPEDLESLAKWLYIRTVNPDKVQLELFSTKVLGHREEIRIIETITETHSHASDSAMSEDVSASIRDRETRELPQHEVEQYDRLMKDASGKVGLSFRKGMSSREASAESDGKSLAEVPMLIPLYGKEKSSVTLEPLDVQWFRRMQELASQDDREFVVRLVSMNSPLRVRTHDVSAVRKDKKRIAAYLRRVYSKLDVAMPLLDAMRCIKERQAKLIQDAEHKAGEEPTTARRRVRSRSRS